MKTRLFSLRSSISDKAGRVLQQRRGMRRADGQRDGAITCTDSYWNVQILIETERVNAEFDHRCFWAVTPPAPLLWGSEESVIMVIKVYIASSSGSTSVRTSDVRAVRLPTWDCWPDIPYENLPRLRQNNNYCYTVSIPEYGIQQCKKSTQLLSFFNYYFYDVIADAYQNTTVLV